MIPSLLGLPSDILIVVCQSLGPPDLASMAITCKAFYALIEEFGWSANLRSNSRPSYSARFAQASWSPKSRLRYNVLADRAWTRSKLIARPLSHPWSGKLQPLIAISPSRLIVAAGSILYSYKFLPHAAPGESPGVRFEGLIRLGQRPEARHDITGITFVEGDGVDRNLYVSFHDGRLEHITLFPPTKIQPGMHAIVAARCPVQSPPFHANTPDFSECLRADGNMLLSLSSTGTAALIDTSADPASALPSSSVDLRARSWTSHLCLTASTPYAAFGTSGKAPLSVYAITPDRISPSPSAILCASAAHAKNPSAPTSPSAVYGLARAPPASPWGSSDQIIVSGWYDSYVRVYDLRAPTRTTCTSSPPHSGATSLAPMLALHDPFSYEPIYDVACGGGGGAHIAAGTARHSLVAFWDVRAPRRGWSVYAPGNDPSPVYAVVLEGARLFGATQSRPFVYDFGPGVGQDTFPALQDHPGNNSLKRKGGSGAGYYVTKYRHTTGKDT